MISIIIPVFNEQNSLDELYQRINDSLKGDKAEIIFINDGSTDDSFRILQAIKSKDKNVRLINFRRNEGKSKALTAGFKEAKGEVVVTMDADLQDQPEEINKLILKLDEGYDLVSGWKKERKDPYINVLFSRVFNFMLRILSGIQLHDINCGFKVYKKETLGNLDLYGDLYRFIPVLLAKQGYKVGEVEVAHAPRIYGVSKYGLSKFINGFFDLFTVLFLLNFNSKPFHLFGLAGIISFSVGTIICIYLTILKLEGFSIGGRPLLILGILLIIAGIQLFTSGLIAELIVSRTRKND